MTMDMEQAPQPEFPELPQSEADDIDWEYDMRRQMQEIVPGLFLGPYSAANKKRLSYLQEHRITHIVCVRHPLEANFIKPNFLDNFQYLVLDVADHPSENIIRHFQQVKEFLDGCLNCGGRVLIHGNAGMSRSASLVIAYLMEKYGLSYRKAFTHVQQKRFCVNPNEGFAHQLTEYEPIYLARHQASLVGSPNDAEGGLKRVREDDEEMDSVFENCKKR